MKKIYSAFAQLLFMVFTLLVCFILTGTAAGKSPDEEAFERHCYVCHPKGGNVITPDKSLHSKDLEKNNILRAADIVSKMRDPGPGMTKFDEQTIPDATADAIAGYVLKTFK